MYIRIHPHYAHRHTLTQTHRHTYTQTHRHTDTWTNKTHRHTKHTHTHTSKHQYEHGTIQISCPHATLLPSTHTHTNTPPSTQTRLAPCRFPAQGPPFHRRHIHAKTHKHTNVDTHAHKQKQTHKYTNTQTYKHTSIPPPQYEHATIQISSAGATASGSRR